MTALGLTAFAVGLLCPKANAQSGDWTWMSGPNTPNAPTQYGVLGVPAAANNPGTRTGAITWTDSSGNFWFFGGLANFGIGTALANDIWVYNPSINQWAWMGGSGGNLPGDYGTLGVPASTNVPGARDYAVGWADASGNLWLFGGNGYDSTDTLGNLNDLWKFNTSTHEWTWIGGSSTLVQLGDTGDWGQPGTYGSMGVPAADNTPGGRYGASSWTDHTGNFWLYGGFGWDSASTPGTLDDLWEFNPSTGEWTWIDGSSTFPPLTGLYGKFFAVFGPQGAYASTVNPGSQIFSPGWTDASGNLWLYGEAYFAGGETDPPGSNMWAFNPATQEWAWMGPAPSVFEPGVPVAGALGIPAPGNNPSLRSGESLWMDNSGNFWLFGGANGLPELMGELNDLWEFNPATLDWVWMNGSDTLPYADAPLPGVYGTMGVPAPENVPGNRGGALSWTDLSGNLWLYGGAGTADGIYETGALSDVWRYQPPVRTLTPTFEPPAGTYNSVQMVTISDATPGATIYYTTDGTSPTPASAVYTGAITASSTQTVQAIATSPSLAISFVGAATYTINQAATPTFSPTTGTFTSAQMVTISDATADATIYYTTDGTIPTAASATYSGPIAVNSTETIQAVAIATGLAPSNVASATITIMPFAATPTFSVPSGTYAPGLMVAISDASPGATIYYDTSGSTPPTTSSTPYTGPIPVTSTEYISAIAAGGGLTQSAVASNHYVIAAPAATPMFSLPAGTYNPPISLGISDATNGVTIYYTTNGTTPTISSIPYIAPFTITTTETVQAYAFSIDGTSAPSAITSATYTMNQPVAATPMFSPPAGTYTAPQSVTISDSTPGAAIYYAINAAPTTSSTPYTGPVLIGSSQTIQAIATASGFTQSAAASATYTINLPAAAAPTFSPPAGGYPGPQTITISDATPGAAIYYTEDGSNPTTSSPLYTGPIFFAFGTIRAIAIATNYSPSQVSFATYTDMPPPPVFSVPPGTYSSAQSVGLSDSTPGVTIYYAINAVPTTSSTPYTGPITVSSTETINAIAGGAGFASSNVAFATYTITPPLAATPVFSPVAGTYTSVQSVAISDATPGAAIYYAINAVPTTSSTLYTGLISVGTSETLEAIAVASGFSQSAVAMATYTINLPPPDFKVSVNPSTLMLAPGQSGTATFTVTPENGFNSLVSFSCSGLPTESACTFNPSSLTPNGSATSTTLTLTTTAPSAVLPAPFGPARPGNLLLLFLALAITLGLAARKWQALVVPSPRLAGLLFLLAIASALASCGGGGGGTGSIGGGNQGTLPGTSMVSVSASTSGGAISHGAQLTVIITQ